MNHSLVINVQPHQYAGLRLIKGAHEISYDGALAVSFEGLPDVLFKQALIGAPTPEPEPIAAPAPLHTFEPRSGQDPPTNT
jgi:hypothetical protein